MPTIPFVAKGAFSLPGIQVRGRLGGMVFVPQPGGRMTVRRAPTFTGERSAKQAAGAARFRPVADAWNSLSIEEANLWRRYGAGLGAKPDGRAVQPNNAFTGLSTKLLQMRPGTALPRLPPTEGFLGDGIRVAASVSPSLACERGEGPPSETTQRLNGEDPLASSRRGKAGEGGSPGLSTPQPPPLTGAKGGGAAVVFRASGPNAEGVVTELLTQRLKSRLRTPRLERYRTAGFVAFVPGALEARFPVERGAWALAVRFVRADTGQETAVVPLGVLEVA